MADNKSTYSSLMNELVDTINEKANSSDSKNLEELVATAKTIVKPEGTLEITENKQYDVSGYALANVNVASSGGEGETRSLKKVLDINKTCRELLKNGNSIINSSEILEFSDTSNVTDMYGMFHGCSNLKEVSLFDTSNVTNMQNMFYVCSNLLKVPLFNTSKVTNVKAMFLNCINLKEIPLFNTSNVTNMYGMFQGCSNLKEIPLFNTSNVTNMQQMFTDCYGLITVTLNMKSVTNVGVMFQYCKALTNLTLYNIKINLIIGSGSSYGHLLTIESLLNTCQECINVNAARTLTVGTANLEKLSTVYVKLTNEPEVDSTLPKLPMVQCESTDEGAMLVADYMALKQWSLA